MRHEQTAAFAAEGWAKVTREVGVCALTAGPGVTNGISAIAAAGQNASPMLVLGGRAPQMRWGQGSLQEIDHVPFVRPLVKLAATAGATAEIPELVDQALRTAITPRSGPTFLDFPLDHVFMEAEVGSEPPHGAAEPWLGTGADEARDRARGGAPARGRTARDHGGDRALWGRGEEAMPALAEELRVPVFLNGLGRGCLPADHELFFSRARSAGLGGADVALVIGVPLDFRLGFGAVFGEDCEIVAIDVAEPERDLTRPVAAELYGALPASLDALHAGALSGDADASARERWIGSLREIESERRAGEAAELADPRAPLHPMRLYGELAQVLDRDAIVVGDGGDFVSTPDGWSTPIEPGCWLDAGPYGCLGRGPGTRSRRSSRIPTPGRAAARRRRLRLQRDGVRHARASRRRGRRRDRQQRHLGAREAPDGGDLRLLGGRRSASGDAL